MAKRNARSTLKLTKNVCVAKGFALLKFGEFRGTN